MFRRKIALFFTSPILALSIICFIFAGISWLSNPPSQKTSFIETTPRLSSAPSTKNENKPIITVTPTITPTYIPTIQPTSTPITQPTATPTVIQTIMLQLYEPDGNNTFSLPFHSGSNPCSLLNDAKVEEKIHSVTIIHYDAPLNSDYVKEINSYADNWTFTLNGISEPKGCSNYTLTSGDTVRWTYK